MGFIRCAMAVLISAYCAYGEIFDALYWDYVYDGNIRVYGTIGRLKLLDWNILAPIWIDREAMKAAGFWDINLLNDETRFELIVQHIIDSDADIVTLQEVQEDVFKSIRLRLEKFYDTVGFAPNKDGYWESYLPEGVDHVFEKESHNSFDVGTEGNVGLAAVLRPRSRFFGFKLFGGANRIIVLNFHLQSGFTAAESAIRVKQGTMLMKEAERISTEISKKFPKKNPIVILSGDANTFSPFPGFTNFAANGYSDSMEGTGNVAPTFYMTQPITLPGGTVITASTLGHVFVRKSDADDGRIEVIYVKTPDITSDKLKEENYIDNVVGILRNQLRRKNVRKQKDIISFLLDSNIFSKLQKSSEDDLKFDTNPNRVLRLGSDHLPVLVEFKITR